MAVNLCVLRVAAGKFAGFENDEVLVEGLEGGVGETGDAVEDCATDEDEIEPFEEGTGGEAIEDGLLVAAAAMEVGMGECGAKGGVLEGLAADDESSFEGGVEVVPVDPVGDAFREGEVVEGVVEVGDGAVDFEDFVDSTGVASTLGADEAEVEG